LPVFRSAGRKLFGFDAVLAAAVGATMLAVLGRVTWLLIDRFHPAALLSAANPMFFATLSPAASSVASACQETVFWLAVLALVAFLVRYLSRWPGAAVLAAVIAVAGLLPGSVHTPGEFLLYYGIRLMYLVAAVIFVRFVARDNYLAYLLTAWGLALLDKIADLVAQPGAGLRSQGGILIALLAVTAVWAFAPGLLPSRSR